MEKALQIQKQVIQILGTEDVYLVGGSVRDLVMGNTPKDYDFTTPMLPDEMEEQIKAAGRKVYAIGKKHGTLGFKVPVYYKETIKEGGTTRVVERESFEYVEVTTFRSEVYLSKSRQPEVTFVSSLDEDLKRRDFTMNAMVLRPDGTIYDPFGGKLDIHAQKIVTVGLPKDRIQEDPLRMLRAARFSARYGFIIDPNFIGKARQLADRIYDVSVERWVQELDKLLTSEFVSPGLTALTLMDLWSRIFPDVIIEDVQTPEHVSSDADIEWENLLQLPHLSRASARYVNSGICARLKFSNQRTETILDKVKKERV